MNAVVYYPTFYPSPRWLRMASLCWDRVYSLHTHLTPDPPGEIRELDEALGGVLGTADVAQVAARPEVFEPFSRWLDARAVSTGPEPKSDIGLFGLQNPKLSGPIVDALDRHGLLTRDEHAADYDNTLWTYVPRDIALHFLSLCASVVATDRSFDLAGLEERFAEAALVNAGALRGRVMTAVLEAYLPTGLEDMEPSRLADLRFRLSDQRHDYEAETQELVSKYLGIRSTGEVAGLEDELIRRATARVDETKKAYRASRIEVASQALGISFAPPAFVSLLASALGVGLLAPAGIAAAVGVAATKMYYEHRSARTQGAPGWSYVLELQRALG